MYRFVIAGIFVCSASWANSNMNIKFGKSKTLNVAVPKIMPESGAPKITEPFEASTDYKTLAKWNGLNLDVKLGPIARFSPKEAASILTKESGENVPETSIKDQNFAWGKVVSFCKPASGGGCVYVLHIKSEKQNVILRYVGSANLVFDFSKVTVR